MFAILSNCLVEKYLPKTMARVCVAFLSLRWLSFLFFLGFILFGFTGFNFGPGVVALKSSEDGLRDGWSSGWSSVDTFLSTLNV